MRIWSISWTNEEFDLIILDIDLPGVNGFLICNRIKKNDSLKDIPLVKVLGLDKLNFSGDAQPDGNFDFIEDITVDSKNGKIIFPILEPFGKNLKAKFTSSESNLVDKYVFQKL